MISCHHAHFIIGVGHSDASRMRRILIGCISAVVLFAVSTAFAVETWRVEELSFEAAKDYTSGGGDAVLMDVAFVHSSGGAEIVRPAFWDGGRTFRVRFAPTCAGDWKWRVKCPDDASLDGKTGLITCVPYSGKLEIYRRGFVKAESGRKYFTYADGTAFFYLGDTHWGMYREEIDEAGPHALGVKTDSHFKYIVNRRVEQGFTVYQSEPIGAKFKLTDGRVDADDIPGFRLADRYYSYIADAGFVHANAEFFFASAMNKALAEDKAALERLSRYWVARFGAWPVMWTIAQEVDNDFYAERGDQKIYSCTNNPWVAVAEFIHKYDAYAHPLSAHQEYTGHTTVTGAGTKKGQTNISGDGISAFADEDVARRTGHNWWAAQWSPSLVDTGSPAVARDYWASRRPAVNYEGRYCNLWTKDFGARAQGWISLLSGFCGYGYGAADMWLYRSTYDMHKDSHDGVENITVADKAVRWSTAIEFPSAIQMGHMKRFFMSFDWWRMEPILGRNNGVFAPESHAWHGAVIDGKRRTFIFYFHPKSGAGLRTGTILSLPPNSSWIARWFNPRSGIWHEGEIRLDADASGCLKLPPLPAEGDWTLVVN